MQDSKKDTDVYSGLLDSEGEGEGGMIWENDIETCMLSCKDRIASLCPTHLGLEDALEECMAIHSSILAWRIPMDRGDQRTTVHGVVNKRCGLYQ